VQSHYVRLDVPRLFGTPIRMWLDAEYHREINSPYYGLGNNTSSELADHPELFGEHPFSYVRRYPQGSIALALPFSDTGIRLSTFARYIRLHIEEYDGSLLALEKPPGSDGGEELQLGFGVLLDRRKGEAVPSGGYLLEAAVRGSQRGMASQFTYLGGTARAMGFIPVGSRIVFATRVEGDALTPGAPLFELSRFGGVDPIEGVGGERTVRGIPRARYIGRVKLIATEELRVRVADARMLDRRVSIGMVAFVDTGRVWQFENNDGAGFFKNFHSGAGGGLRLYHREFVIRMDVGTSHERAVNFYLTFGNFF
jgi:hypothetical protein